MLAGLAGVIPAALMASSGLTLSEAIRLALDRNPDLALQRTQHRVDAAGVAVARVYPYNPSYQTKLEHAVPPPGDTVARPVSEEHQLQLSVETRGQMRYRRNVAASVLMRTDAQITATEQVLLTRVVRLHATVLYRQRRLALADATVELNAKVEAESEELSSHGLLRGADAVLVGTETADAQAAQATARIELAAAVNELNAAIGLPEGAGTPVGRLEIEPVRLDPAVLLARALSNRADLKAQQLGVREVHARTGLVHANRYGVPQLGFVYEQDTGREKLFGATLSVPLPVINDHRTDIAQMREQEARASAGVRQVEIGIRQSIQAALRRLEQAQAAVTLYRDSVLPKLATSRSGVERLFAMGDPAADVLRVFDVRRKQLRAQAGYLDALFQVREALSDLVGAVGDPDLVVRLDTSTTEDVR